MPDGHFFEGEGPEVFMVHPDYEAADAKVADPQELPAGQSAGYVPQADDVAVFVADPWESLEPRRIRRG
jgi:hypothetical protein